MPGVLQADPRASSLSPPGMLTLRPDQDVGCRGESGQGRHESLPQWSTMAVDGGEIRQGNSWAL